MSYNKSNFPAQSYASRPIISSTSQHDHFQSDIKEQQEIIYKLKQRTEHLKPSQTITLQGATFSLEPDSTLEVAMQPGRQLLQKMSEQIAFKKMIVTLRLPEHSLFEVTSDGEIIAIHAGKKTTIANALKLAPDLKDDLDVLVDMAQVTGGIISLADTVGVVHWLNYHRYFLPRSAADASRLIDFMEREPVLSPPLGNYWEMIKVAAANLVTLTADQRRDWRGLISSAMRGRSLLESLSQTILGGRGTLKRSEAENALETLVSSPIAFIYADSYVRDMGWYGAKDDQPQSDLSRKQMLLTALLLDLHPDVGEQEPRNHVAGFNVYAVEHMEKNFDEVQTEFERHLTEHHRITEKNVALAAHLLLAEAAPEFLVKDLPATLTLGTPPWVEFCRVVAAQEIIAPGSTRAMTYAQLQQMAKLEPVCESQQTLESLAAIDPVIDWALLNRIVTQADVEKSVKDSLEAASAAYGRHANTVAEAAEILARPRPTRKGIALENLMQAAKGCVYLERDVLYHIRNRELENPFEDPFRTSPLELHMSNDLVTGDWDRKGTESIYKTFPDMLSNLVAPDNEFYRQFNRDYVDKEQALNTHLKQALASLPRSDRIRLLKGKLTVFTVRPSVAKLHEITPLQTNVIAQTIDVLVKVTGRKPTESLRDIEWATGRYGVIICSHFAGRLTCYELFTLQGICRENSGLAEFIQNENLLNADVRSVKAFSLPAKVCRIPTNIECYTHAVPPALDSFSDGIIEKIGELSKPAQAAEVNGYYQCFYSTEFDPLVNFVLKHRPIATYNELVRDCWGQTPLEALRAKRNKDLETFLDIVVPFKSCIEDLNSGDLDRELRGVSNCTVEAGMTILLVIGTLAKIASIVAKGVSVATKASAIASASLVFVSNLFNPLDGALDALNLSAKVLRKGWRTSVAVLENAIDQARKWSGKTPHPSLLATIDRDTIRLGAWSPAQSSQDVFQVWGVRSNNEWYALSRGGHPWGGKLENFHYKFKLPSVPWHRILPKSYTERYIKKAIPVAKAKLDTALHLLTDTESQKDVRKVLNYLFGTGSDEAVLHIEKRLRKMREDLNLFTLSNVSFKRPDRDALAALNTLDYAKWKKSIINGTTHRDSIKKFIKVFPQHMDNFYKSTDYDKSRIADILIHEMSHGAPGTLDLYYGATLGKREFNAAPLIDLARNPRMADPSFPNPYRTIETSGFTHLDQFQSAHASLPVLVQHHPALHNADSYEIAVSLIEQIKSDPFNFQVNMYTIETALNNTPADKFLGTLAINIGRV